jgi:hypothetical protein
MVWQEQQARTRGIGRLFIPAGAERKLTASSSPTTSISSSTVTCRRVLVRRETTATVRGADYSNDHFEVNDSTRTRDYFLADDAAIWVDPSDAGRPRNHE